MAVKNQTPPAELDEMDPEHPDFWNDSLGISGYRTGTMKPSSAAKPKSAKPKDKKKPAVAISKKSKKSKKSKGLKLSADLFTEGGVGSAFYAAHSSDLIAVREWKCWANYQPATGRWIEAASEEIGTRLLDWFKETYFEQAKEDKELFSKARRFRELTPCNNAARYAFGKSKVSSSIFDADADVLLTVDGAVNLKKGKLRAARPDDYFTKTARAGFDAGYKDPLFDEILSAFPEGVAEYLQVIIGNALTGHALNQDMVFFFSADGSNGKSTFTDVIKKMMGAYADRVDSSILLNSGDNNLFGKAKLKGLRAAFIEELPKSNWLDAQMIKELAETAEMTAAKKFQDEETFDFNATVFVNTNYLPQVSENDRGTWRRLAPIPMPYTYVSAEEYAAAQDPESMGLRKKNPALASAEKNPSILKAAMAWAVEGAQKWYEAGCVEPPMPTAMEKAKNQWRGGQDKIELWWSEWMVADPDSFCLVADLHDTFEAEMNEIGRPAEKTKKFMDLLQAHGLYKEAKGEYVRRQRAPKDLVHSAYLPPKKTNSPYELDPQARTAKGMLFYVSGVRFRTESDDLTDEPQREIPSTVEELLEIVDSSTLDDDLADLFG